MMRRKLVRMKWGIVPILACLAFGLGALGAFEPAVARADDNAENEPASEGKSDNADEKEDPYAVPDAEPAELLTFLGKLENVRPKSVEELKRIESAKVEAAEKILAAEVDEQTAVRAVKAKLTALSQLARYGDRQANAKMTEFAESLQGDKRQTVAEAATFHLLAAQARNVVTLSDDEQDELVTQLTAVIKRQGLTRDNLQVAMRLSRGLEYAGQPEQAARAYRNFAELAAESEDEAVARYGPKLEGAARRVQLPGHFMALEGRTVEGEQFDWDSYRGKVVLVDFWATWCGPCIAELPNVKKNYELYYDRGFDVVGISLDRSREKLEEFLETKNIPWTTLYSDEAETTGWDHPMATEYGVTAIPTAILVDKQGEVVSLRARGGELDRNLEELLGPPQANAPQETGGTDEAEER